MIHEHRSTAVVNHAGDTSDDRESKVAAGRWNSDETPNDG